MLKTILKIVLDFFVFLSNMLISKARNELSFEERNINIQLFPETHICTHYMQQLSILISLSKISTIILYLCFYGTVLHWALNQLSNENIQNNLN